MISRMFGLMCELMFTKKQQVQILKGSLPGKHSLLTHPQLQAEPGNPLRSLLSELQMRRSPFKATESTERRRNKGDQGVLRQQSGVTARGLNSRPGFPCA